MNQRTLHDPNAIPRDLWRYSQFVVWKYEPDPKGGKDKKRPINPQTLGSAGPEWPNTWAGIHTAVGAYKRHTQLNGIGFMLTQRDPIAFVDLDDCILGRELSPTACQIVSTLCTYTEVSPSGAGLRLIVSCADKLPTNRKASAVEVYGSGSYCTLTGNAWGDVRPLATVSDLDTLMQRWLPDKDSRPTVLGPGTSNAPSPDDDALWQRIFAKNILAEQLYQGDLSGIHGQAKGGGPDKSRAVILLLNSLAIWTKGDEGRMKRMMYQTRLDKTKWEESRGNGAWLDYQIADAVAFMAGRGK